MTNRKILQTLAFVLLLSPCLLIRAITTKPNLTLSDHAKNCSIYIIKKTQICQPTERLRTYRESCMQILSGFSMVNLQKEVKFCIMGKRVSICSLEKQTY